MSDNNQRPAASAQPTLDWTTHLKLPVIAEWRSSCAGPSQSGVRAHLGTGADDLAGVGSADGDEHRPASTAAQEPGSRGGAGVLVDGLQYEVLPSLPAAPGLGAGLLRLTSARRPARSRSRSRSPMFSPRISAARRPRLRDSVARFLGIG